MSQSVSHVAFRDTYVERETEPLPAGASLPTGVSKSLLTLDALNPAQTQPLGGTAKRLFDVVIASVALVALFPLMAIIAILLLLVLKRPIFFAHSRVGWGGRTFRCYKFRTMVSNADEVLQKHLENDPDASEEWRKNQKLSNDPRVPWLGRFLRVTSLDELPQLINVLRGDMSCVGPRPVVVEELARYGENVGAYLRARPGLSGSWQVRGRNALTYESRVALDRDYVENWSMRRDIGILLLTIPAVLRFNETA